MKMYEGWSENAWTINSVMMALVANCHRSSKGKAFKPEDFNPYARRVVKISGSEELDRIASVIKNQMKR